MASVVRALRGATTVVEDSAEHVTERVQGLVREMMARNGISHDDIISVVFTSTEDVRSIFPATAARGIGLGDVPLICAKELSIVGSTPLCVRVLMHMYTERHRRDLHHVYLEGASSLRDDLPE
jgi:chorismate mutase